MQIVQETSVKSWTTVSGLPTASSVSETCPFCDERVIFSLSNYVADAKRSSVSASATCPGCSQRADFWTIKMPPRRNEGNSDACEIFMYPVSLHAYPHPILPETVPIALQRALNSTIDSLNAKNFPATAVGARRTLEGIFKYLVTEEKRKKPLFQLIDEVKSNNDLAQPLESLSHAIRTGGNLGAHFDDENEPTEPMARKMVELLDYLISYLYVLPSRITDLEKNLGKD